MIPEELTEGFPVGSRWLTLDDDEIVIDGYRLHEDGWVVTDTNNDEWDAVARDGLTSVSESDSPVITETTVYLITHPTEGTVYTSHPTFGGDISAFPRSGTILKLNPPGEGSTRGAYTWRAE